MVHIVWPRSDLLLLCELNTNQVNDHIISHKNRVFAQIQQQLRGSAQISKERMSQAYFAEKAQASLILPNGHNLCPVTQILERSVQ